MKQKVAVIGAGLSGLVTIKELVEAGHDVTCFEKGSDIGGVFSELGTYDSVKLTVSNYFMAYSDFMPYADEVRFWTRAEYKAYLDRYAEHFQLRQHIQFDRALEKVDAEGDRIVITLSNSNGEMFTEDGDRLAICSGQFQRPNIPHVDGVESFTGPVMHSAQYKSKEQLQEFQGKRVLCFGMGESAADVVAEVAEIAASTTLSLRRLHVFSQREVAKHPIDVVQTRLWHSLPARAKSESVRDLWRKVKSKTAENDPLFHLADHILRAPDEAGSVVTKTERVFEAVANGMRIDIGGVANIKQSTVTFKSGVSEDFDAIMFCTGFKFNLPFMDEKYHITDIRDCYLQAFHPVLRDRVAFIGFVRPQQGGVPLMAELQARYFALLCSGKRSLPEHLEALAQKDKMQWMAEFYETPHVFGLVNGLRFNERVADLIGCRPPKPNPLASPNDYFIYWYHHIWPCQYRLVGPGAKPEALTHWRRAPCYLGASGDITFRQKLKLIQSVLQAWLKSLLKHDVKEKWRPAFSK